MQRREFITLLGGAVAAWPIAARAQPNGRIRTIGVLTGASGEDSEIKDRIAAFLQELQRLGWTEGRNMRIVVRGASGSSAATHKYAAELVSLAPDVSGSTSRTQLDRRDWPVCRNPGGSSIAWHRSRRNQRARW